MLKLNLCGHKVVVNVVKTQHLSGYDFPSHIPSH
jgi:hypothetical protein